MPLNPFKRGGGSSGGGNGGGGNDHYRWDDDDDDDAWEDAEEIMEIVNDPDFDEWDELGMVPHTPLHFDRDDEDGPSTEPLPGKRG